MRQPTSSQIMILVAALSLVFADNKHLRAGPAELEAVRKAIEKSGARWTAGETAISRLPPEERRKYLGTRGSLSAQRVPATFRLTNGDLPTRVDWRDRNGANWMTPVKDQGGCGSCWAFSAVGTMESTIAIRANNPTLMLDLSEQYLLSCGQGSCSGFPMFLTFFLLQHIGVVDEGCLPYSAADSLPCNDRCIDWSERIRKIDSWAFVPNNVNAIRTALTQSVLSTTFQLYSDFYYYDGGVYEHVTGGYEGDHAVVLVGYDAFEHSWIAKNSWNPNWGENGYFRILWGDSRIGTETGIVDYSNPCDDDEDGHLDEICGGDDCDDEDYLVYPGATEICDGKDSNCDAVIPPDEMDGDTDSWSLCNDCDDTAPDVNPGQVEICGDAIDNDCSGTADDKDVDGDGDLDPGCGGTDCDDENRDTYGGAYESCDGLDNNCDGHVPQAEMDLDGDTWLICAGDCEDDNDSVHPGRPEDCGNEIDDDCDGQVDGDDIECTGYSAVANAEASVHGPGSVTASGTVNELVLLMFPLATVALLGLRRKNLFYLRAKRLGTI